MKRKRSGKPKVILAGKVEKIIEPPVPNEPEKAQIGIEGADTLYREIRINNVLKDEGGGDVRLNQDEDVDVTVEADRPATKPKKAKK